MCGIISRKAYRVARLSSVVAVLILLFLSYSPSVDSVSLPRHEAKDKNPSTCGGASSSDTSGRPRFALLVGIDSYEDQSIPPTPGSAGDVTTMKDVLVECYGFKEDGIKTLTNKAATREGIVGGFRDFLIARAKSASGQNPIVVFYFSGHGVRYPNQAYDTEDADSSDGWDEAIVPYDSRGGRIFDILDDEIDDLSAELAEHSSDILFIFDSCHSGTVTRSDGLAKEAPPDPANGDREPYRRKFKPSDVDTRRAQKIVTLAAALPDEKAWARADKRNSAMTFELAAALRRASSTTTYRDLMREVRSAVASAGGPAQTPSADGDELRPVLGATSMRADGAFRVVAGPADGKIKIDAGLMHGLKPGSVVAVYSESAVRLSGTEGFIAYASVEAVSDRESTAVLPPPENPSAPRVTSKSRVVLASPTFGGGPVALVLDDPTLAPGVPAVRTEVEKQMASAENADVRNGLVELRGRLQLSSLPAAKRPSNVLVLKKGRFGEVFKNGASASLRYKCFSGGSLFPPVNTEVLYLQSAADATGLKAGPLFGKYFEPDDPSAASQIVKAVSVHARRLSLMNIENSVSGLNDAVQVEVEGLPRFLDSQCANDSRKLVGWYCDPETDPVQLANDRVRRGQVYRIRVSRQRTPLVPKDMKLYVAVLGLTADGDIVTLNRGSLSDPLTETQPLQFLRVASQPAGVEVIKVIIGTKPEDVEAWKDSDVTLRNPTTLLAKLLSRPGTRSAGDTSLSPGNPDSWGVKTLQLSILSERFTCAKGRPWEVTPRP